MQSTLSDLWSVTLAVASFDRSCTIACRCCLIASSWRGPSRSWHHSHIFLRRAMLGLMKDVWLHGVANWKLPLFGQTRTKMLHPIHLCFACMSKICKVRDPTRQTFFSGFSEKMCFFCCRVSNYHRQNSLHQPWRSWLDQHRHNERYWSSLCEVLGGLSAAESVWAFTEGTAQGSVDFKAARYFTMVNARSNCSDLICCLCPLDAAVSILFVTSNISSVRDQGQGRNPTDGIRTLPGHRPRPGGTTGAAQNGEAPASARVRRWS